MKIILLSLFFFIINANTADGAFTVVHKIHFSNKKSIDTQVIRDVVRPDYSDGKDNIIGGSIGSAIGVAVCAIAMLESVSSLMLFILGCIIAAVGVILLVVGATTCLAEFVMYRFRLRRRRKHMMAG